MQVVPNISGRDKSPGFFEEKCRHGGFSGLAFIFLLFQKELRLLWKYPQNSRKVKRSNEKVKL